MTLHNKNVVILKKGEGNVKSQVIFVLQQDEPPQEVKVFFPNYDRVVVDYGVGVGNSCVLMLQHGDMDLDCISSDFKLSVPKQIFRIIFKIFIRVANVIVLSPKAFFLDLLERWDVRELYIPKTADLPMQLCLGTFPHFVAIGFYFLSETLIYKSLHQSFFYSFITILPSERGFTLHYSTIFPYTIISSY